MIRIRQVKVSLQNDNDNYIKKQISKILKINEKDIIKYSINKKSLDARKKENINFVYEFDVEVKNEKSILSKNKNFVVEGGYVVSNEDEAKYLIEHCP